MGEKARSNPDIVKLVETTRQALDLCIAHAKPGVAFKEFGDIIEKHAFEESFILPSEGDFSYYRVVALDHEKNMLHQSDLVAPEPSVGTTLGIILGICAGVGSALGVWYVLLNQMIDNQRNRNDFLQQEITKLDEQIKSIDSLQKEIDGLKARKKAVEDLQTDRNVPVYLLNELVKQTPEGIYLTSISQVGNTVTVNGMSQTNDRVSEFLRNISYNSPTMEKPDLVEIKAVIQQQGSSTNKVATRMYDFQMRVNLKKPAATEAASAASSVAAPASAAVAPMAASATIPAAASAAAKH